MESWLSWNTEPRTLPAPPEKSRPVRLLAPMKLLASVSSTSP